MKFEDLNLKVFTYGSAIKLMLDQEDEYAKVEDGKHIFEFYLEPSVYGIEHPIGYQVNLGGEYQCIATYKELYDWLKE